MLRNSIGKLFKFDIIMEYTRIYWYDTEYCIVNSKEGIVKSSVTFILFNLQSRVCMEWESEKERGQSVNLGYFEL